MFNSNRLLVALKFKMTIYLSLDIFSKAIFPAPHNTLSPPPYHASPWRLFLLLRRRRPFRLPPTSIIIKTMTYDDKTTLPLIFKSYERKKRSVPSEKRRNDNNNNNIVETIIVTTIRRGAIITIRASGYIHVPTPFHRRRLALLLSITTIRTGQKTGYRHHHDACIHIIYTRLYLYQTRYSDLQTRLSIDETVS